jgi:prevent-host-death family protein
MLHQSTIDGEAMERVMSATEARVHFGEVLTAVAEQGDTVIVERAGRQLAVVIPLGDYEHLRVRHRWEGFAERRRKHREFLDAEYAAGRLKDWNVEELIRQGREERDEQLLNNALRGR